ncbi:hypothetical protein [Mongoliitalea lutea]|uniref:Uncharacterized protein n=1 Tax=Mongoliitalea lutea TaxID=849756 RepID=A0A8J3CWW4_9BACT|nr:hypothetical protein [Mongoliitalea lutea]GHB30252.1 hypothetical protein GCM10008106_08920 [Mongoliitalea lutea]
MLGKSYLYVLVFILSLQSVYCQSSSKFSFSAGPGLQTIISKDLTVFGGFIGAGFDLNEDLNRWHVNVLATKFSTRPLGEEINSFRGWSSNLQIGRIWTTGMEVNQHKVQLGGGIQGVFNFHQRQYNMPGFGAYFKVLIPILTLNNQKPVYLMFEPSYFGDGIIRNFLGLNYRL